jgi:purine-binding chemotaxis protein CheW
MINQSPQAAQGYGRELLSFRLGGQDFCIDVMAVREIRGWTPACPLPNAPAYLAGVVNLRGVVLPIVDLAIKLGLPPAEPTKQHVIIVVQVGANVMGLLVDGVNDILMVTPDMIQPTPPVASDMGESYVIGLITIDAKMVSLLQLEQVLPPSDMAA